MSSVSKIRAQASRWYHLARNFRAGLAFGKRLPATQLPVTPATPGVLE